MNAIANVFKLIDFPLLDLKISSSDPVTSLKRPKGLQSLPT